MASDICPHQAWKVSRNIDATVELEVSCDAIRHWSMHNVWTRPAKNKQAFGVGIHEHDIG